MRLCAVEGARGTKWGCNVTVGYRASKCRRGENREIAQIILSRSAELMTKHGWDCDDPGDILLPELEFCYFLWREICHCRIHHCSLGRVNPVEFFLYAIPLPEREQSGVTNSRVTWEQHEINVAIRTCLPAKDTGLWNSRSSAMVESHCLGLCKSSLDKILENVFGDKPALAGRWAGWSNETFPPPAQTARAQLPRRQTEALLPESLQPMARPRPQCSGWASPAPPGPAGPLHP